MEDSLKTSRIIFLLVAMSASMYAFATQNHSYKYRTPEPMPVHMLKTTFLR